MVENEEERGKKITHSLPYPVRSHQPLKKREEKRKEKRKKTSHMYNPFIPELRMHRLTRLINQKSSDQHPLQYSTVEHLL